MGTRYIVTDTDGATVLDTPDGKLVDQFERATRYVRQYNTRAVEASELRAKAAKLVERADALDADATARKDELEAIVYGSNGSEPGLPGFELVGGADGAGPVVLRPKSADQS
jgi:hypothetical protein